MISTVTGFVGQIQRRFRSWESPKYVWFRGEPDVKSALLPKLYRPKQDGSSHHENKLLQMFRMRASVYSAYPVPDRGHIDQWLFLAQHVGLPTRLLDWTENALIALFFAIKHDRPVVWMLDPMRLNQLSIHRSENKEIEEIEEFPLTWFRPEGDLINIGHENIRGAWENDRRGVQLPVAVYPTYAHPRMSAQRSVFTVQGLDKRSLVTLIPDSIREKFIINPRARSAIANQLRMLGIEEATAFPDLDGLAKELSDRY
jgi:hypothetical protein